MREEQLRNLLCAELKRQLETKGMVMTAIPSGGELLWRWFLDLNRTRTYHMSGPNPISHADILSYGQVMRWPIEPRHIAILRAMDETWMQYVDKRAAPLPDGVKVLPTVSKTPLTAGMIDAMFGRR